MLDVRGGNSSFPGEMLGAVETLLTPREWPRGVIMEAVLYAVPPECLGSVF